MSTRSPAEHKIHETCDIIQQATLAAFPERLAGKIKENKALIDGNDAAQKIVQVMKAWANTSLGDGDQASHTKADIAMQAYSIAHGLAKKANEDGITQFNDGAQIAALLSNYETDINANLDRRPPEHDTSGQRAELFFMLSCYAEILGVSKQYVALHSKAQSNKKHQK